MGSVSVSHSYLSSGQIFGQSPPAPVVNAATSVGVSSAQQPTNNTGRGPFASALRNLAKQADIKEDDTGGGPGGNEQSRTNQNSAFTSSTIVATSKRSASADDQMLDNRAHDSARDNLRKTPLSPQPPEKVKLHRLCFIVFFFKKNILYILSKQVIRLHEQNIQPELLARSGFQPYRPDERSIHPAGAFPLDIYSSPFGLMSGLPGSLQFLISLI